MPGKNTSTALKEQNRYTGLLTVLSLLILQAAIMVTYRSM